MEAEAAIFFKPSDEGLGKRAAYASRFGILVTLVNDIACMCDRQSTCILLSIDRNPSLLSRHATYK